MRRLAAGLVGLAVAAPVVLGACSPGTGTPSAAPSAAQSMSLGPGSAALLWGDGAYGVVLLHDAEHAAADWAPLGQALAADGMSAVAPDRVDTATLRAAILSLRPARVAVIAIGPGISAVADLAASDAPLIDQVVLVSLSSDAGWAAQFPKLFVAGHDASDALPTRRAEAGSAGEWNELLLVPGDGSGQGLFDGSTGRDLRAAVLRRLDERR